MQVYERLSAAALASVSSKGAPQPQLRFVLGHDTLHSSSNSSSSSSSSGAVVHHVIDVDPREAAAAIQFIQLQKSESELQADELAAAAGSNTTGADVARYVLLVTRYPVMCHMMCLSQC
jgi:hypothetical protein